MPLHSFHNLFPLTHTLFSLHNLFFTMLVFFYVFFFLLSLNVLYVFLSHSFMLLIHCHPTQNSTTFPQRFLVILFPLHSSYSYQPSSLCSSTAAFILILTIFLIHYSTLYTQIHSHRHCYFFLSFNFSPIVCFNSWSAPATCYLLKMYHVINEHSIRFAISHFHTISPFPVDFERHLSIFAVPLLFMDDLLLVCLI